MIGIDLYRCSCMSAIFFVRFHRASSEWSSRVLPRDQDSENAFILASGGADGTVHIWRTADVENNDWEIVHSIDHSAFEGRPKDVKAPLDEVAFGTEREEEEEKEEEKEPSQIYALQFIDNWRAFDRDQETQNSFLLSSSDDFVHLWEVNGIDAETGRWSMTEVMSIRFINMNTFGYGVVVSRVTDQGLNLQAGSANGDAVTGAGGAAATGANLTGFGGDRNPNNLVYVFEASYSVASGLLGVALSDGAVRLVNGRGVCVGVLKLPGIKSHLTSFAWDSSGTRLSSCVATGHVILWELDISPSGAVSPACAAVLEGGK